MLKVKESKTFILKTNVGTLLPKPSPKHARKTSSQLSFLGKGCMEQSQNQRQISHLTSNGETFSILQRWKSQVTQVRWFYHSWLLDPKFYRLNIHWLALRWLGVVLENLEKQSQDLCRAAGLTVQIWKFRILRHNLPEFWKYWTFLKWFEMSIWFTTVHRIHMYFKQLDGIHLQGSKHVIHDCTDSLKLTQR